MNQYLWKEIGLTIPSMSITERTSGRRPLEGDWAHHSIDEHHQTYLWKEIGLTIPSMSVPDCDLRWTKHRGSLLTIKTHGDEQNHRLQVRKYSLWTTLKNSTENRLASKTRCVYGMMKTEQNKRKKNKNWSEVKREEALKESYKIWGNVQGRPFWKSTRSLLMTWDHHHYHERWNTKAVNAAIASVRAAIKPYFKLSCLASIFLTVSS